MKSEDPRATAKAYIEYLDEQFFMIGGSYLEMAKKEGNVEVIAQIQKCMDAAMAEKTATLRPEIQLLNLLVNGDTKRINDLLSDKKNQETLKRDNGYFFTLVKKMYQDVKVLTFLPHVLFHCAATAEFSVWRSA